MASEAVGAYGIEVVLTLGLWYGAVMAVALLVAGVRALLARRRVVVSGAVPARS